MTKAITAIITMIFCLFLANTTSADVVMESFATRDQFSSGNLIWNQALGIVHPRLEIQGYGGGASTDFIDVGDGSDGPFQRSTYTTFDPTANDTDKIVRINTNKTWNFTKFELDAGWKLIPEGTSALKINSLSTVVINGEIHCQGGDGQAPTGGARLTPGNGGVTRCGGGAGGSGGQAYTGTLITAAGQQGFTPDSNISGGHPGTVTAAVTTGAGGGGGGAFSDEAGLIDGRNGAGGNAIGGAEGTNFIDHTFINPFGGAGGGGGSGSNSEAGAGGGGGGGAVFIHAVGDVTLGTNGFIFAHGGNGADTPGNGGAGGAGGGGSIQIFAGGNFLMQALAGVHVDARKGTPGQSLASAGTNGDGGIAHVGRTWIGVGTYDGANTASYLPTEDPAMFPGDARYEMINESVISKSFDTLSTLPAFVSIQASSNDLAQVTVEVAGSSDDFISDNSGWLAENQIASLNNKRYLKFRLNIDNNSGTVPVTVSDITVTYSKGLLKDFEFKGAGGCGLVKRTGGANSGLYLLFLLLPFIFYKRLRRLS